VIHKPRPVRKLDERLGIASVGRTALAKVFPDHWSFMLGEIALYSFILLVATGVYLTLFFEPSSALRVYDGSYAPLHGEEVSGAYASSVELSWDVPGGLLMRQAHHWAAHIFIGAIVLHLCRIFFTGSFRRPRELNWMIGLTLLILAIFNAFAGYSLPDDLLSGTGLRIFQAIMISIPVVGGWMGTLAFGGEFPGTIIIERLYALHILLVPAVIAGLITAHLGILIRQKHTHFPGPGRRNSNVVGSRVWPAYALRSMALLCAVAAVVFLAGGLVQVNPIWAWGDFEPYTITSPSVADWYILWIEGALRLFPPVEFTIFGGLVPNQFWAGVFLPGITFLVLYLWPWIDRRLTGDRETHHLTGRPREAPVRVGIGVAALTFFAVLLAAGSQELLIEWTRWPIGAVRNTLRVLVLVLPVVTGVIAWWAARALKRSDLEEGLELGRRELLPLPQRDEDDQTHEEEREEAGRERTG
jgi:ubiquinol-cytochrome c reductase cytochrome b subunit